MAGAHSVFDALSDKGISVTEESFGALAVAYAEQGNIDGVMKILDKMSETRVFPSHRGFLNILRALAPHPQHIPDILRVIKNKKYMIADLCRLMVDCASQGHFDAAFNLLSVIVDYSRVFNRALLERSVTMVTSHMMNSNVSNDMVFELSQRLSPLDDTVCRQPRENLLLYLSKQDDPDIAVRYARELDTRGIPIRTHYLFPVLVKGITAGNSEQVVHTLQAMMDLHLNMSDHNLINLFQPSEGENFMLQCFEEAGLMKDSKFMCELIQYFWSQKHPDISLKLLFTLPLNEDVRQLLRDGYTPTIGNSLKLVATAMVDEGDISDAVVTTLKLAEMDFLPPSSNVTIALILKKLAIKGDRAEFFQFLGKLKDLRFPLSDQVLKEVIHFASTIGDIDKCMVTFNQLQIRNGASYSELLRALCLQRRVPQAESCYREMLAQGFKPHRNHMAQYIKLFLDMGDTKAAEDYRKEMEGFGYDIHHSLRQEFIKTYCMKGDFDKAKAEIRDVLPLLQELNYSVVFPRILLMKGYLSHGSPEGVRETLDEMKEEEVTIEPPQIGLLLEGYMNSMDQESILNLIQTAKDTYGVPPSMVSILRVLNKLVAMDDYDTATEVVGHLKALYEQSEDAIAHVMLFAELLAGHKEKALDMAMTKSFAADKQRLLGFIKHLRQINKKEMVEVVKKIIDFHQDGESDPE
jgi:leucine-rich PPR motif-containing protein